MMLKQMNAGDAHRFTVTNSTPPLAPQALVVLNCRHDHSGRVSDTNTIASNQHIYGHLFQPPQNRTDCDVLAGELVFGRIHGPFSQGNQPQARSSLNGIVYPLDKKTNLQKTLWFWSQFRLLGPSIRHSTYDSKLGGDDGIVVQLSGTGRLWNKSVHKIRAGDAIMAVLPKFDSNNQRRMGNTKEVLETVPLNRETLWEAGAVIEDFKHILSSQYAEDFLTGYSKLFSVFHETFCYALCEELGISSSFKDLLDDRHRRLNLTKRVMAQMSKIESIDEVDQKMEVRFSDSTAVPELFSGASSATSSAGGSSGASVVHTYDDESNLTKDMLKLIVDGDAFNGHLQHMNRYALPFSALVMSQVTSKLVGVAMSDGPPNGTFDCFVTPSIRNMFDSFI